MRFRIDILILKLVFIFLFFLTQAYSQTKVSLDSFVKSSCKNDTQFKSILVEELKTKYHIDASMPNSDFVLKISEDYGINLDDEKEGLGSSIKLSKLFTESGTVAEAGFSKAPLAMNDNAIFSLNVSQPIAKNAFGKGDGKLLKKLLIDNKVVKYQIVEAYEDYMASLLNLYQDWYLAYEKMKNAEYFLKETKRLYQNTLAKRKKNIALDIDVNRAKLQLLQKREDLAEKKNDFMIISREVATLMGLKNMDIVPVFDNKYENRAILLHKQKAKFSESSRTNNLLTTLENKKWQEVKVALDDMMPSADLFIDYKRSFPFDDFSDKSEAVLFGLNFEISIGRTQKRAVAESLRIDHKKQVFEADIKRRDIQLKLSRLWDEIKRYSNVLVLSKERQIVSSKILDDEKKNFKYGRSDLSDLITAQNSLETEKISYLSKRIALTKLMIEWLRLSDQLVINLPG